MFSSYARTIDNQGELGAAAAEAEVPSPGQERLLHPPVRLALPAAEAQRVPQEEERVREDAQGGENYYYHNSSVPVKCTTQRESANQY